jgi:hypothetical protein
MILTMGVSHQNMTNPKFAFVIIASNIPKFQRLKRAQLETWVRDFKGIAPIYFIYGNGKLGIGESNLEKLWDSPGEAKASFPPLDYSLEQENEFELIFNSVSGWDEILPNTLAAFRHIKDIGKFDFLIRTNLSSYWNRENTVALLRELPLTGTYAGPLRSRSFNYVEGDAMIFSSDVTDLMLENRHLLNSRMIDDLAIADLLSKFNILPLEVYRPTIRLEPSRLAFQYSKDGHAKSFRIRTGLRAQISSFANIRCKDPHIWFGKEFRLDPLIMFFLRRAYKISKFRK